MSCPRQPGAGGRGAAAIARGVRHRKGCPAGGHGAAWSRAHGMFDAGPPAARRARGNGLAPAASRARGAARECSARSVEAPHPASTQHPPSIRPASGQHRARAPAAAALAPLRRQGCNGAPTGAIAANRATAASAAIGRARARRAAARLRPRRQPRRRARRRARWRRPPSRRVGGGGQHGGRRRRCRAVRRARCRGGTYHRTTRRALGRQTVSGQTIRR